MRVDVLTVLPEMFDSPMSASIIGRAREKGALDLHVHDIRDWTHDRHRTTDDEPYGGGPGMVMKPEPVAESLRGVQAMDATLGHVVFLTPIGQPFDQSIAEELSALERIVYVCGRYEGFDERSLALADRLLSVGDYVLTGGELASMVVIDAVTRLLPGVLGHENSTTEESFSEHLLEYPQYTRPPEFEGAGVPEVLRSGDHARIAAWRHEQSVRRTARFRPDLLDGIELAPEDRAVLDDERERSRRRD